MRPENTLVRLRDLNIVPDGQGGLTISLKDTPYQHQPSLLKVQQAVPVFDETFIGCPLISERDGRLLIVDGQHRILLLLAMGIEEWRCEVYSGLSMVEEAALYRAVNGNRRRVMSADLWNADVHARNAATLAAKAVLDAHGIKVGAKRGPMTTPAPAIVLDLNRRGQLDDVLQVLKAYNYPEKGLEGAVMDGYGRFMRHYPEHAHRAKEVNPTQAHGVALGRDGRSNTMLHGKDVEDAILSMLAL